MSNQQHNELVEVITRYENGHPDLAVHVATWPHLDRLPLVMWQDGSRCSYLPAAAARRFAEALVSAAEKAEASSSGQAGQPPHAKETR